MLLLLSFSLLPHASSFQSAQNRAFLTGRPTAFSHDDTLLSIPQHVSLISQRQRRKPSSSSSVPQPACRRSASLFYVAGATSELGGPANEDVRNSNNSNSKATPTSNQNDNDTAVHSWESVLQPTVECDGETNQPCFIVMEDDVAAAASSSTSSDEISLRDKSILSATAVGLLGAIAAIVTSNSGAWRYYLAGGICAAVSHLVPVPVDVVKTRKQIDPSLANSSLTQATKNIVQQEGWTALFVGAGPTFWGYFLEGAIKFGVYEVLKPLVQSIIPIKFLAFVVSAAISGLAASVILCPMEALRIRLVAEPEYAQLGWIQGGIAILKREGLSALSKGILPMIYKQVPYTITKNVSFDVFTRLAYAMVVSTSATTKLAIPLCSAMAASVLSCVTSQPGDMLLSLANANGGLRRTHDVCRDIWRSDKGLRGFFVGIRTRFLHVGIIVTMQLMIYDVVKQLCGIAATGTV